MSTSPVYHSCTMHGTRPCASKAISLICMNAFLVLELLPALAQNQEHHPHVVVLTVGGLEEIPEDGFLMEAHLLERALSDGRAHGHLGPQLFKTQFPGDGDQLLEHREAKPATACLPADRDPHFGDMTQAGAWIHMKRGIGDDLIVDLRDQRKDLLEVRAPGPRGYELRIGDIVPEQATVVLRYAGEHGGKAIAVVVPEGPEHDEGVVLELDDLAK